MDVINIVCIAILIIAVATIIAIKIYKNNKEGKKIDLEEFVKTYGDQIISVLKDVVKFITISESDYSTKEEYEKTIIELTIEEIKQNYKELGIDIELLSIIDTESLSNLIYNLLHGNAIDIFSVLDADVINEHKYLYDDKVVAVAMARLV